MVMMPTVAVGQRILPRRRLVVTMIQTQTQPRTPLPILLPLCLTTAWITMSEKARLLLRNVYESLGETLGTTTGLKALIDSVNARRTNVGNTVDWGAANRWAYNYIDGDLTINGNPSGYGVLVVTGRLAMGGNFSWHGTV